MAAALMTLTQCKKQETTPSAPSADTIRMTITAGPGAKTNITDDGAITWSAGDKLYVSDGTNWLGSLTLDEEYAGESSGKFTGDVTIGEGTNYHFFYLGKGNITTTPSGENAASISFASQDGTRDGALKYHLGHGTTVVTVRGGEATGAVKMRTEIAMAHLKLTMDSQPYKGSVTMDVSNTMTVTPAGDFSGSGNGINMGNNDGNTGGDRYVTLIPTTETNVSFSGSATGSLTFGQGIQANNLYGMANGIVVTLAPYVDLGLPSGLLWATCNLGASKPEDYGDYYAWGETATKNDYSWATYEWCNGSNTTLTKYNNSSSYGTVDNKTTLESSDDAAHVNWGGLWRMPTEAEFTELINNTNREWTTVNGVAGYKCSSTKSGYTDKYIFLPAAGYRYGTILYSACHRGYYWSSSLDASIPYFGRSLNFYLDHSQMLDHFHMSNDDRCDGFALRPVCPPQN